MSISADGWGSEREVRPLQSEKANSPTVTEAGSESEVMPLHSLNAESPINLIVSGSESEEVILVHPEKAFSPTRLRLLGIFPNSVRPMQL